MINKIKNNKALRIIAKVIKTILTFIIICVVSIIFVQRVSNNEVTLGGYRFFTVVSESMLPKYKIGDMLVAKEIAPNKIEVGDDLVYYGIEGDFKDRIVTHQVIEKRTENGQYIFTTKGLANSVEDPEITDSQVYGVVLYKTIILSFLSTIVNSSYGFFFVIFIPLALMIFLEIIGTIKEKEEE